MIRDTIDKLEAELAEANALQPERRAELLELLASLRDEVNELAASDGERARSIATFTEASAHEATRKTRDQELFDLSLKGLSRSVEELKSSHPRLAQVVGRLCNVLSNLGI